jgi:hypothetical protein
VINNLFIVGAQRSGSTYLYHILDNHPQVCMARPVKPEPKYFLNDELSAKGRDFYEKTYFSDCTLGTCYFGEKSTSYIESLKAAKRIHGFYPSARIIMILRNPVERAWSNYCFSVSHGLEDLDFESALAAESRRLREAAFLTSVNPFAYRQRGLYINYINDYLTIFNRRQIYVLILEEIVSNLAGVQNLYRWLGVDDGVVPTSLNDVVNSGYRNEEVPADAFRNLARGYQQSLLRLEEYLGRQVDAWRCSWESM